MSTTGTLDRGKRDLLASARSWWECIDRTNTLGLAAQVAFWVFLALLPLAAVLGLVVSRLAVTNAGARAWLAGSIPGAVRDLVTGEMARVAKWNGGEVGPLAAAMFVWFASGGVQSIFSALELQVGVSRPWWKTKLVSLATCVAISIGVAGIALLASGATWVFRLVGREVPLVLQSGLTPVWTALRFVAALALAGAVTSGLYWAGTPRSAHGRAPILPAQRSP